LKVVHITNPTQNFTNAEAILSTAQTTAQGKARIALVAALGDVPGWYDPASPEPNPTDYATQEANQFLWMQNVDFAFLFALRAELELRAGGNPSFNNGVNYQLQLKRSADYAEVQALYAAAGLSLDTDLATLNSATRIQADAGALTYLTNNVTYNGQLSSIPVLTLHTTGDGLVTVENEKAYKTTVHKALESAFLRETFVHRAGHCEFTPAETIAAFQTLSVRLATGKWKNLTATDLNNEATGLGPAFNVLLINGQLVSVPPAFVTFAPLQFLRVFDAFTH
jgi:hypothetical protein